MTKFDSLGLSSTVVPSRLRQPIFGTNGLKRRPSYSSALDVVPEQSPGPAVAPPRLTLTHTEGDDVDAAVEKAGDVEDMQMVEAMMLAPSPAASPVKLEMRKARDVPNLLETRNLEEEAIWAEGGVADLSFEGCTPLPFLMATAPSAAEKVTIKTAVVPFKESDKENVPIAVTSN